ncbi:MAG: inorganic phosphate transporter [Verrucomicrobia bacterium]|nr:inorganic phosphate transporter [Verrucomicrobiota bacterium]MBI3868803.1 inorganic phosphate transporter [Verrucomicrobiota bacterium]
MALVLLVILIALVFEFINGFHDCANAIATSIGTRALTPTQAILLAAALDLVGALTGTTVAKTIGVGLVDASLINVTTILCALIGGILWNLTTWYYGLPSSSSHALMGGLCGAAVATIGGFGGVIWFKPAAAVGTGIGGSLLTFFKSGGLLPKVLVPMFAAPLCGLVVAFVVTGLLFALMGLLNRIPGVRTQQVNRGFRLMQLLSSSWMAFEHGRNDAQKTMGIIALTLFLATTKGNYFDALPPSLEFLRTPEFDIALWVKITCAVTMACGVATGGWRIIRTLGKNMVKLTPLHGFAAQTTAAMILESATSAGIPLSTTHVIAGAVMGVGATKRLNAVKWSVAERMLWAWVMTIPICGAVGFGLGWIAKQFA